uniref:Uncharacterized protein n=1 Tax=Xenopus tropicalis TaxID=8364 RepID=A0A6I8S2Z3_XENTR
MYWERLPMPLLISFCSQNNDHVVFRSTCFYLHFQENKYFPDIKCESDWESNYLPGPTLIQNCIKGPVPQSHIPAAPGGTDRPIPPPTAAPGGTDRPIPPCSTRRHRQTHSPLQHPEAPTDPFPLQHPEAPTDPFPLAAPGGTDRPIPPCSTRRHRQTHSPLQHPEAPTDPFPPAAPGGTDRPIPPAERKWKVERVNGNSRQGIVSASPSALLKMIDTFDRPPEASAVGPYAGAGTYANGFKIAPGKWIPKAGAYAGAGVGKARAAVSVLEAEAKGPNASAGAEVSAFGAGAMAKAEVGSVSATAGPLSATLGLGVNTGVQVGLDGVETKIFGTGVTLGPRPSISFVGSEVACVIS